jgi:hypothetical protein
MWIVSAIVRIVEALKTAQQQLKVYRQSVLKWAFEGRLTNKNVAETGLNSSMTSMARFSKGIFLEKTC